MVANKTIIITTSINSKRYLKITQIKPVKLKKKASNIKHLSTPYGMPQLLVAVDSVLSNSPAPGMTYSAVAVKVKVVA